MLLEIYKDSRLQAENVVRRRVLTNDVHIVLNDLHQYSKGSDPLLPVALGYLSFILQLFK